jgi:hypothetical protein
MPAQLEPGVLYVSEEYGTAAHLCPCGCGSKVRTPLAPTEWSVEETSAGPSLEPSVGNWQKPCRSHYWIRGGDVVWAPQWSTEEILAGRRDEEARRLAYFTSRRRSWWRRIGDWLTNTFKR